AVAVVGDPDRFTADRDRARFGADVERRAFGLVALEIDPADGVVRGRGDPEDVGAGVDPTGAAADLDRIEDGADRRLDCAEGAGAIVETVPEGLSATQTKPRARVIPAGPGPAGIGGEGSPLARSMRLTLFVVGFETQSPPAPTARRSGAACGAMPRRKTLPPLA